MYEKRYRTKHQGYMNWPVDLVLIKFRHSTVILYIIYQMYEESYETKHQGYMNWPVDLVLIKFRHSTVILYIIYQMYEESYGTKHQGGSGFDEIALISNVNTVRE